VIVTKLDRLGRSTRELLGLVERIGDADWFNNRRLLEPIGNIPPVEAEETLLRHGGRNRRGGVTQTK